MPATLRSNSGELQFAVALGRPLEYAHERGFESSLDLRGRHWDGTQTFPYSTTIEGIWLSCAEVMALRDHIARWTALSLDRLDVDDLSGTFKLARLPGQCADVCFGARSDTISGLNPVISITFSAGALHGVFHFVSDQSCLSLFVQELSAELDCRP
jgi:hypothetical protein